MKYNHTCSFLVVASIAVSLLLHGVPHTLAFARRQSARIPKPRQATTVVKQSSRALFSPSEMRQRDENQFQDVAELQTQNHRQETLNDDKTRHWMKQANNVKLLQNPVFSGLDRGTAMSVTATSFLAVLTLCALFKGSRLAALFRHTDWWVQYLFNSYRTKLVNNPLSTKVATGAVLAVLGDALAQSLTNGDAPYDKRRAASFAVFDSCYRVFQHFMFPAVIAFCQGNVIARFGVAPSIGAAVERTMVYQLVVVPCVYYPVFFAFTGFIQGLNVKQSIERFKTSYFRCWRRNLSFWIPTQLVLFGVINEHFQIPFACLMGMLWSMILSLSAGKTK